MSASAATANCSPPTSGSIPACCARPAGCTTSAWSRSRCPRAALSAADRRALEQHPAVGYALLTGADHEPLDTAAELAWTHHERFDGGGYPRGLTGTGIPAGGRIAAVADTFDALTTERPYRAAVSVEEAAGILRGERGRQLDPDLVDGVR